MRKKAIVFLAIAVMLMMICTSLLAGCGDSEEATGATDEYAPDYLVLVNKEQPISEDYVDTIKLVKIKKADGDYVGLRISRLRFPTASTGGLSIVRTGGGD